MQQSITVLQKISCKKERFFELWESGCNCTFVTHYHFQNDEIAQCVAAMETSKDFAPLLHLSRDFDNHAHLHDDVFSREYLLLIFIAYRNLIINNAVKKDKHLKKGVMYVMAEVYEAIDSIPPDKILEAIELLTHELPAFLEEHEFNSDMSWKQWLKEHWVASFVIFIFGIKLLTILIEPIRRRRRRKEKQRKREERRQAEQQAGTHET